MPSDNQAEYNITQTIRHIQGLIIGPSTMGRMQKIKDAVVMLAAQWKAYLEDGRDDPTLPEGN